MKHILRVVGISVFVLFVGLPAAYAYGEGSTFAGSTTNPPTCSNTAPKTVWPFLAKAGIGGSVDLSWGKTENASSWTVAYGVASHKYIYGISNFGNGDSRSLQLKSLPAGTYYVAIRANNGCMPGPFSNEWKVVIGGGSAATGGQQSVKIEAVQPQITAAPTGDNGYTQPTVGSQPNAPSPVQVPVTVSWWQSILNFLTGLFGKK